MNLIERIASMVGYTKEAPHAGAIQPSVFSMGGRNSASSARPGQGNMADSLNRYADEAWVYSCVRIIQTKGAEVPLKVYREVNGKREELPDHPLKKLLDGVNQFMDRAQLMEGTHGFKELTGNAFWLLDAMVNGKPTEIHPLNPAFMKPLVDKTAGLVGYEFRINGMLADRFEPSEIIHFRYWNPLDPFWGQPPISAGRDGADMIKRADQYNISFFDNSAEAGGFLTTEKPLVDDQVTRIKAAWAKNHQGARKANRIEILHGGLEWKSNTTSHKDMLFPDLKRMSREDVLACFMIPPVMGGIYDEANYSNADVQERLFWKNSMRPRLSSIDSVLTERLGKPFDNVIVAHDTSNINELQEDQKLKAERDRIQVDGGIKTINEVRAEMNLPPVEWGDTWNAPFSVSPISDRDAEIQQPGEVTDDEPNQDDKAPAAVATKAPLMPAPAAAPKVNPVARVRGMKWMQFKASTEAMERRWFPVLRRLFIEQEKEVIRRVRDSGIAKIAQQVRLDKFQNFKQRVDVVLFDRVEARKIWQREGKKLIEFTLNKQARLVIQEEDLGVEFNLNNPNVQKWINSKAFKFAEEINASTEEALRQTLKDAITEGEAIDKIEDRIAHVFDIARGSRTRMIARTEVIAASNAGSVEAYKQSGVVEGMEWISSRDSRVRDTHQIDGEKVDMDETFSNGLKFPGDPDGAAEEVINCRCTTAPVVKK